MIEFDDDNNSGSSLFERHPFFSIGLFSVILGIVLLILGWTNVACIFFGIIPVLIIVKILLFIYCAASHPVTKFSFKCWLISILPFFIGIILAIFNVETVSMVFLVIGWAAIGIGAVALLVRIFIAIFISKY